VFGFCCVYFLFFFFFSSRRRHTRFSRDWSSDVCSSDLGIPKLVRYEYTLYPTVDNQSTFEIPLDIFDVETDSEVIVKNTVTLDRSEERRVGKESRTRETR